MGISIKYGPQAGTLAGVAGAIGTGRGQQEAAKQRADLDRMTLGALLQDRSQQADYNFRAAGMVNGANLQNFQNQQDLQRQQIALNMGAQQAAWQANLGAWNQQANLAADAWQNQQQLEQQAQLAEQKRFDYELNQRSQAKAAMQQLSDEEMQLQRALDDGYLTEQQYGEMRYSLAAKRAAFDPQQFPRDSIYPEGQDMGEIWQEQRSFPGMGDVPVNMTRDRNGVPTLTDDSKLYLQEALKAHFSPKAQDKMPGMPDAGKPTVTMKDFSSMYESISKTLAPETIDAEGNRTPGIADPAEVDARMQQMIQSYRQHFDPNVAEQLQPGSIPSRQSFAPGAAANTQGMQFGGQEQPAAQPGAGLASFNQFRQQRQDLSPDQFAQYLVSTQPKSVLLHLQIKYPDQSVQVTNPDDLAMFEALRGQQLGVTSQPAPAAQGNSLRFMEGINFNPMNF